MRAARPHPVPNSDFRIPNLPHNEVTMSDGSTQIEALLADLPDACKDVRLNLQSILRGTSI